MFPGGSGGAVEVVELWGTTLDTLGRNCWDTQPALGRLPSADDRQGQRIDTAHSEVTY